MRAMIVGFAVLLVATPAFGQVYKCKGKSGETVYQQDPCNPSSQPINVRGTKPATPSRAEDQTRATVFRSTDLSDAAIAERQCVASSHDAIYRPSNERVAAYRNQIAALNKEIGNLSNNLAGATAATGLRSQISGLQDSIASEETNAAQLADSATQRCAAARQRTEQAIEKRYAPTATP
jgi:hypothetical protein